MPTICNEQQNLFVIEKRYRFSNKPQDVKLISVYYIINNAIFQAPTLARIVNAKMANTLYWISQAEKELSAGASRLYSHPYCWAHLNEREEVGADASDHQSMIS